MEDFSFLSDGITYHVIATYYDSEYTKKNYMIYTDNTLKDDKLQVYYSIYEECPDNKIKLLKKEKIDYSNMISDTGYNVGILIEKFICYIR